MCFCEKLTLYWNLPVSERLGKCINLCSPIYVFSFFITDQFLMMPNVDTLCFMTKSNIPKYIFRLLYWCFLNNFLKFFFLFLFLQGISFYFFKKKGICILVFSSIAVFINFLFNEVSLVIIEYFFTAIILVMSC